MTLQARMTGVVDVKWLSANVVRVGSVPVVLSIPDTYVAVMDDDNPILRVDVYAYLETSFAFQEAIVWHDNVVIGFGSYVYAVCLTDDLVETIALAPISGTFTQLTTTCLLPRDLNFSVWNPTVRSCGRARTSASMCSARGWTDGGSR